MTKTYVDVPLWDDEPVCGCGCLPAAYDDGYQCECGDAHVDTCQGCAR